MDTLFVILISGMAATYVVEFVTAITSFFIDPRTVRVVLNLPLSALACWFLDLTSFELIIGSLAAAFFSLALLRLVNRPVTVQTLRR